MGLALEHVLAAVTLAATGDDEAMTPGTGDTFTVRNAAAGSLILLEEVWAQDDAHPALLSIKSPNLHDQVRGLLLAVPSGALTGRVAEEPSVLFPGPEAAPLQASDTLSVEANGTAADNVLASMLVRYENLPNADAGYLDSLTVRSRLKTTVGILVQPTTGALDYGVPVALDSVDPRVKAGKEYAILGALTDTPVHSISIQGPMTSNYRIGMPGTVDPPEGGDYFMRLSDKYGTPHIPVFNGTDKGNVLISAVDVAGGTTPNITVILAQLL